MCENIEKLSDKRVEETRINGIVESVKGLMKTMKLTTSQALEAPQVSASDSDIVIKRI